MTILVQGLLAAGVIAMMVLAVAIAYREGYKAGLAVKAFRYAAWKFGITLH